MKTCTLCGEEKPLEDFYRRSRGGYHSRCKTCFKRRQQEGARHLWRYGMTKAEYDALPESQGGVCAICGEKPDAPFHLDHDHACCGPGRACRQCVRGLLCPQCNVGLGSFRDDELRLKRASSYLRKHRRKAKLSPAA